MVVALLAIAITTTGAAWLSSKLSIKGGLKELLPENYPSVVELDRALERIGGVGSLIVTVQSPNTTANQRFMDALALQLNTLPDGTIRYLDYKAENVRRFYEKKALYYMEVTDLDELYDAARHRIDTEKLKRSKLLITLSDDDPLETKIDDIKRRNEKNNASPIKTFEDYYGENDGQFLIMLIRPHENSLSTDAARRLIATVEDQVAQLHPKGFDPAMTVGFCGNVKSTVEEYDTLKKDILSTALLCITLVGFIIALFFMRLRVVFLLGATLVIALSWTFAITYLAIGYLNSQTAFLGSIILGTGINYGIIVMARYIEERRRGHFHTQGMCNALIHTLKATFLAAATTAVAFLVLLLAKIRGLNQFGIIGAYGVMLCWLATITVLPVLALATERVRSMVTPRATPSRGMIVYKYFGSWISTASTKIVIATIALAAVSIALVAFFAHDAIEYDFTKLRNKTSATSGTEALEHRVSKLFNDSMTPSVVIVDRMDDAALVCDAITAKNNTLPENERRVGSCRSIFSLVPKDQAEKLPRIQKFSELLRKNDRHIRRLSSQEQDRIASLKEELSEKPPTLEDVPKDITKHFEDLHHQPGAVVFVSPRAGMLLSDGRNLIRFADTIRDVVLPDGRVLHAAGASLIFADLVDAIRREAPILTLASFLCVLLFVAFLVRSRHAAWVIVLCVGIGVITMLGVAAGFKIKLNFFNFIALPLTFGIGVDYAVNMVLRLSKDNLTHLEFAFRHTGIAVVLCSLTTTIGYSVLIVANNQALASFGVLAMIGEITCLLTAIILAPALLIYAKKKAQAKGDASPLISIFVVGILLLTGAPSSADTDVNVYDDTVYLYLDKLAASKLIRTYSPNQRPLSRTVAAQLIAEAESRCPEDCPAGDKSIIHELSGIFAKELDLIKNNRTRGVDFVPINVVNLSWTATNQPESTVPNNGLGSTGGTVQPLLSYNNGQHYLKYANFYLDTSHSINATPYFSAHVQPQAYVVSGSDARAWLWLWRAYVKAGAGDFEIQIGRDELKWGPGEQSLMFSNNFKGFDMIKLTTPSPFHLPWVFRHLGQWRFTTFFALLGKGFSNPNAILSAYRVDWHPIYWLDFGFDHAVIMGGSGATDPSVVEAIDEYVAVFSESGIGRATSNHMMGADFTVRVPPLLGMEFYGKLLLEDTQREYYYMLVNDASWLAGLYFPKLDAARKLSLRAEFVYTGQYAYRHSFYTSGFSIDGKFTGYDAGPDTYSATTSLRHQFNFDEFIAGSFRYLYRSSNTYAVTMDASGNATGISTVTHGPKEQHYLFKVSGTKRLTRWLNIYADAGLDTVINKGFVQNNNGVDFSTQVKLIFHNLVKQ